MRPDRIDVLNLLFLTTPEEYEVDALIESAAKLPGASKAKDTILLRFDSVQVGNDVMHGVARFRYGAAQPPGIDLDLRHGSPRTGGSGLSFDMLCAALGAAARPGKTPRVIVFTALTLLKKNWRANLTLPVGLPGMTGIKGAPEVTGFEFSFREEASPLLRAYISTLEAIDEYKMSLQMQIEVAPPESLLSRLLDQIVESSSILVTSTQPPELREQA